MGRPPIPPAEFERLSFEARFRPSDVARLLGKSDDTIRRWARAGLIDHVELGGQLRFTEKNVKDYLAKIQRRSGSSKMSAKARAVLGV